MLTALLAALLLFAAPGFHPDLSHPRVKPGLAVHTAAAQCDGTAHSYYVPSGDISDDLYGALDARPEAWGYTDAFSVPLVFNPPSGCAVRVISIAGDLSGMPKHLMAAPVVSNAFAGVLEGFSTNQPYAASCNLCALSTPQYRQDFVADGSPFHSPFTYTFRGGVLLASDNVLNSIGASFLNTLGVPVHVELTYTITYQFEEIQQ